MPRHKSAVKDKRQCFARSFGAVDLHFHGAFGIDLMAARSNELDRLSKLLWDKGVAAFCPTTLSAGLDELQEAVDRLGRWIRKSQKTFAGAKPLGIHLEGPYLNHQFCGAHPPRSLRKFKKSELLELWECSHETLKIITIAPEILAESDLKWVTAWARKNKIVLSMGHSMASLEQAQKAIRFGFSGVTHAWNALKFHHRSPGVLGAALGNQDIHIELMIDQIHVSPEIIQWTRALHPGGVCFISDCTPAAATKPGTIHRFGPLSVRLNQGASRLKSGELSGGGSVLTESYIKWIQDNYTKDPRQWVRRTLNDLNLNPLKALGLAPAILKDRKVGWILHPNGKIRVIPFK